MTERHTRQGRARGQKHGTLDREPVSVPHDAHDMWAAGSHSAIAEREKGAGIRAGAKFVSSKQTIAGEGCWCGKPVGHAWDKNHPDAPHPEVPTLLPPRERPTPPRVLKQAERIALQEAGICPLCKGIPLRKTQQGFPWCDVCLGAGVFPPLTSEELAKFRQALRGPKK